MNDNSDKIREALDLLESKASDLFDDPAAAGSLRQLLAQAKAHEQEAGDKSPHLEELEALVHTVVRIEDAVSEVKGAADTILDWIAKGGRSLGLD